MTTVRDFGQVFDAYAQFEESMISAKMETAAEMGASEEGVCVGVFCEACVLCEVVCVFSEGVWCGVLCKVLVWMCGCVKMCVCGVYVLCEGVGCTCESACMDVWMCIV